MVAKGKPMAIVIIVVVVVLVLSMSVNSLKKTSQRARGRGRCQQCNSRLKAYRGQYATTCRKCGHTQSWGASVSPQGGAATADGPITFMATPAQLEAMRARVNEVGRFAQQVRDLNRPPEPPK